MSANPTAPTPAPAPAPAPGVTNKTQTIKLIVTTPPTTGAGYILSLQDPKQEKIKVSRTGTTPVKLVLLTQNLGATTKLSTPPPGTWQFPNLGGVIPNASLASKYQFSFWGISFITNDAADTRGIIQPAASGFKNTPSEVSVLFNVTPSKAKKLTTPTVTIQYRVQVIHQLAAQALWLDPSISDGATSPPASP